MSRTHIGPLIRQIRLARGISIRGLARNSGMEGRACNLSRYERGLKDSLRVPDCLYPIAEALGTSVPALFMVQEICLSDPSILENKFALVGLLEKSHRAIEQIYPKRAA